MTLKNADPLKRLISTLFYPINLIFFPILSLIVSALPWRKMVPNGIGLNLRDTRAMDNTQQPNRAHENRVHVFYGTFASELEATDYCITPIGRNKPEPLTRDLPDATLDTNEIEIIFGAPRIGAAIPSLTDRPDGLFKLIGSDNTIILLAEAAFCGLPYTLNDTPRLTYAGAFDVT